LEYQSPMFLTLLHELDTACTDLSPTDHLHVLKTTLALTLPRRIKLKLEKLELLDAVLDMRKCLLHTHGLFTITAMQHELYKKIQQLEQELNLTDTYYHPPEFDWSQSSGKYHRVTRHKESLILHIPDGFRLERRSFLSSSHEPGITIHISILDAHLISTITEQLHANKPTFIKQDLLGRPTQIDFQISRAPPGNQFTRKDAFEHCCVFYNKDPTITTYLDLINCYAFGDTLPLAITNILRETTGQPLLEYPTSLELPGAWPEAQPTNAPAY
jgi:hypothetical protein